MYQSWGVIGLGLSVFAVSPFMPTQRFGMMMLMLLTAALVGNLVLLPALLMSPLGKLFGKASKVAALEAHTPVPAATPLAANAERSAESEPPAPRLDGTLRVDGKVRVDGTVRVDGADDTATIPTPHLRRETPRRESPAFQRRAG